MTRIPDITLTTEYVAKARGKYYFVASKMNAVCSIDIQTQKMEIVGRIPEAELFSERLCIKIIFWNGELIFVPFNGEKVWFFNFTDNKWHSLSLENADIQRKFRQAFIYEDKLFMIGCHYPAIVYIDLKTKIIQYIDSPFKTVQNIYDKSDVFGYFRHDCVIKGHLLYFASFITNKVLIFNLNDYSWKYVTVGRAEDGYSGIVWDGRSFWLSPCRELSVVKWDGEMLCEEYPLPYQENNKNLLFIGVVFQDGDIVFPAQDAEYTIVFHNANIKDYELKEEHYLFYTLCDSGEIVCGKANGEVTILLKNGEKNDVQCSISAGELFKRLNITRDEYEHFLQTQFSGIGREKRNLGLNDLFAYIDAMNQVKNPEALPVRFINHGETIWRNII